MGAVLDPTYEVQVDVGDGRWALDEKVEYGTEVEARIAARWWNCATRVVRIDRTVLPDS